MFSDANLSKRQPVWLALSELWLDTELSDTDLRRIAAVLEQSQLTVLELESVYREELAPVVYKNLHSVAGVWTGFDAQWLSKTIVQNLNVRPLQSRLLWLAIYA